MVLALTFRSLTSTLLPQRTIGMFSQTRTRSPVQRISLWRPRLGQAAILTVPVGNVLVGDTGGNIKHDDTALAVNVVSITETTELLLSSSVPHVELDLAVVL